MRIGPFYSGEEFAKALSTGTLKETLILTGMVKQAENDPTAIMFSEGTYSDNKMLSPTCGTRGISR